MTNKQKVVCVATLLLGVYASWNVLKLYMALETTDLFELLLIQALIALLAFMGGMAIINGDKIGHLLALMAWVVMLYSELQISTAEEGNSYFVSILSILSLLAMAVLIYDIVHDFLHKKT